MSSSCVSKGFLRADSQRCGTYSSTLYGFITAHREPRAQKIESNETMVQMPVAVIYTGNSDSVQAR